MNILAMIGSPIEEGNSALLVREMLKEAVDAQIKTIHLNKMNMKGCQSCMYCRQNDGCSQQDDMQQIYPEIEKADIVVIGFPIYMWQMTGQTKLFIDRLFAYYKEPCNSPFYKGKKVILAVCQGADEDIFKGYIERTCEMFTFLGFDSCESIVAGGTGAPDDVMKQPDTLEKARNLLKKTLENDQT